MSDSGLDLMTGGSSGPGRRRASTPPSKPWGRRIVTLLDRNEPQRADHVLVDDVVDAERGVLDTFAKRLAEAEAQFSREASRNTG